MYICTYTADKAKYSYEYVKKIKIQNQQLLGDL